MYKIKFIDGTVYTGGSPENSLWNKMPNKPIKSLTYNIFGKTIIMENYECYNHVVFKFGGVFGKTTGVNKIMLMVKQKNEVLIVNIDCIKKKITYKTACFGKEFNGKPIGGWKKGLDGLKGRIFI